MHILIDWLAARSASVVLSFFVSMRGAHSQKLWMHLLKRVKTCLSCLESFVGLCLSVLATVMDSTGMNGVMRKQKMPCLNVVGIILVPLAGLWICAVSFRAAVTTSTSGCNTLVFNLLLARLHSKDFVARYSFDAASLCRHDHMLIFW